MGCGSSTAQPMVVLPDAALTSFSVHHTARPSDGEDAAASAGLPSNSRGLAASLGGVTSVWAVVSLSSVPGPPPSPVPSQPGSGKGVGVGGSPHHLRQSSRQYSQEHASSVPHPRATLSQRGARGAFEIDPRTHVRSRTRDNMPAVRELLSSANILTGSPIRGALVPNFYRSAAAFSGGASTGASRVGKAEDTSFDSSLDEGFYSDEEEEMDEEEHRETLNMLQELTMLSVPSAATLARHSSTSSSEGQPDLASLSKGLNLLGSSAESPHVLPPAHRRKPSSFGTPSESTPPRSTRRRTTQPETLFHGFYAKRCIHTVKKSLASTGMFMTFKDMFDRLDPTRSGVISRADWAALLQKLGLPVDSTTSLSRIVGLADTPTITLEQFATVMALSMHGPYVRLLQSTQKSTTRRNEVFIGGDKAASAAWRKEATAIFGAKKVPFFNPAQAAKYVSDDTNTGAMTKADNVGTGEDGEPWNAEVVILEALAKSQCALMLFVVDGATRSIASMVEASEHITSEKEVLMVMQDVKPGTAVGEEVLSGTEAKDLNRGRAYLADVAHRNAHSGVTVFKSVAEACDYIAKRTSGDIVRPSLKTFTKPLPSVPSSVSPTPTPAAAAAAAALPPRAVKSKQAASPASDAHAHSPLRTHAPLSSHATMTSAASVRSASPGGALNTPPPSVPGAFPMDSWPINPQPADFDRYMTSAHFLDCARIVFKHQGLLSRRAATKASLMGGGTAGSAGGAATPPIGSTLPPPGVFRLASSPIRTPLKLRRSGSATTISLAELVSPATPPAPAPAAAAAPTSPIAAAAASNPAPTTPTSTPPRRTLQIIPSGASKRASGNTSPNASLAASPASEVSRSSASVPQSTVSQTRILLHMSSQSESDSRLYSPSVTRPATSGLALTEAGTSTTNGGGVSTPTGGVDSPSLLGGFDDDGEVVLTVHLFTMLIRLHEIVQLSTGISFLHPYPNLVSQELDAAGERVGDVLRFSEWFDFARRVFGQLRGIHEAEHPVPVSKKASGEWRSAEGPTGLLKRASTGPAPTGATTNSSSSNSSSSNNSSSNEEKQTPTPTPTPTAPGSVASESPVGSQRQSHRLRPGRVGVSFDLSNPLLSMSAFGSPGAPPPFPSASTGNGISPSQFLRHLSGQSKRSSGAAPSATPTPTDESSGDHSPNLSLLGNAASPAGSYHASSRATGVGATGRTTPDDANASHGGVSRSASTTSSTGTGVTTGEKPKRSSNSSAVINRVKARIAAQRQAAESLLTTSSISSSSSLGSTRRDDANTLSSDDLRQLAASVTASLQHDEMLLKKMLPSFQAMFNAVEAQKKAGTVSMEDVATLLAGKLALPTQSCDSLMAVLNVALTSCQHEAVTAVADAHVNGANNSAVVVATATPAADAAPSPLPLSALDPHALSSSALAAVLSKTLHLQSSPFSSFLSSDRNFVTASRRACSQVFLGGSCNPTTWRFDEAIPILSASGVTYYNPQVDGWSEELVLIESLIKSNCEILLFVIDSETRAIASMIEASEYICSGRDVVLVVKDLPPSRATINSEELGAQQVQDLNRGRSYVTDVAQRHGLDVFTDITLACEYIVSKLKEKQSKEEQYSSEVEAFISSEEFLEKTVEEFFRCVGGGGSSSADRMNAHQLLLACLHLEQDLRPLLPPQSLKHRQPSMADVEVILQQFGGGARELDCDQFIEFSRVLFRNVCAHVKL